MLFFFSHSLLACQLPPVRKIAFQTLHTSLLALFEFLSVFSCPISWRAGSNYLVKAWSLLRGFWNKQEAQCHHTYFCIQYFGGEIKVSFLTLNCLSILPDWIVSVCSLTLMWKSHTVFLSLSCWTDQRQYCNVFLRVLIKQEKSFIWITFVFFLIPFGLVACEGDSILLKREAPPAPSS